MRASLLFLPALLLLGSANPLPAASPADALAPGGFRWLEEGAGDGPLYMVISIDRQMVHVYRGDRLIGQARVSTGTKGHRTPTGQFPILQKRQWHRSNLYSNAPMPFMQRLTWDGIALHAGHDPGYPASHGCIRLPYAFARQLFALTRIGTPVEVTTNRLNPALLLDPLVLGDPGHSVVTFTPANSATPRGNAMPPPAETDNGVPMLEVDPAIFGLRFVRY
ncbi:L,D-transpeptidase family protein [Sphingobium sp.]|uniref:L,D-transpeptidase family protein n=1 Tax=Sphingobium sp. TaxID=1912891 RepID=UPI003BB5CB56